jgi:hypothetical protein
VVGEDNEVMCFQHVVEMLYGLVDGQQLTVVCSVFLLGRVEFLGKESEGMPGVLDSLLKHGTHGEHRGVCDKCKCCRWMRLCQ